MINTLTGHTRDDHNHFVVDVDHLLVDGHLEEIKIEMVKEIKIHNSKDEDDYVEQTT